MSVSEFTNSASVAPMKLSEWFILVKLEHLTLVFPSALVAETFLIERSQILALPFYNPAILGCVHQSGQIVPLVSLHQIMDIKGSTRENLTVIRLSNVANVAGIGLVVDSILGREVREQLPDETALSPTATTRLFRPEVLAPHLWQPQRWCSDVLQPVG